MTETAPKKSCGLKFAEQQLLRHGWEQGKGLGRAENGIAEAIRVKVKCGKGGVGHKESEQFTFHWWDHVFNKASSSLAVESDQNGVTVNKVEEDEEGMISNKKPRKAMMNKSMLYGSFVKSATLFSGQEQPEEKSSASEDSSSEDEEKLDLSSAKNLSDIELMKACGGRTAHKGARHGLTMSAKLARLEQQEQEFMAKYGKKEHTDKPTPQSKTMPAELTSTLDEEKAEKSKQEKARKKERRSDQPQENGVQNNSETSQEHNKKIAKKQKKQSKDKEWDATDLFADTDTKKKKKKTKDEPEEESTEMVQEGDVAETAEHQATDTSVPKKKKKRKKKKHIDTSSAVEDGQITDTVLSSEESAETAVCPEHEQQDEGTAAHQPTPSLPKKKKKKSSKTNKRESQATEMGISCSLDTSTAEVEKTVDAEKESSQSKKRKSRNKEIEAETGKRSEDKPPEKKRKKKKHA
ncbi:G patch domain-containing protein 4 [Silurus meridionalis]|uniref:G patch domain-containing protein 4 n=1 Tax=Silurus meridionalis TaxID=175797 RepID=A0A8T0BN58_SILME|nr:G patch domain-containing protein 4 [Silurus meridionalis]KAF7708549.1 hypothetical protein HF521_017606 [Silurus meridionalis]